MHNRHHKGSFRLFSCHRRSFLHFINTFPFILFDLSPSLEFSYRLVFDNYTFCKIIQTTTQYELNDIAMFTIHTSQIIYYHDNAIPRRNTLPWRSDTHLMTCLAFSSNRHLPSLNQTYDDNSHTVLSLPPSSFFFFLRYVNAVFKPYAMTMIVVIAPSDLVPECHRALSLFNVFSSASLYNVACEKQ